MWRVTRGRARTEKVACLLFLPGVGVTQKIAPRDLGSCSLLQRFDGDLKPEALQSLLMVSDQMFPVDPVEVIGAEIVVRDLVFENVVDNDKDAMSDCDDCLPLTSPLGETMVLSAQIGVLGSDAGMGGLDEGASQVGVALARLPASVLSRALIVPRTDACPRGKMLVARKNGHVDADLGDHGLDSPYIDSRDAVKQLSGLLERDKPYSYLLAQFLDRFFKEVDMGEDCLQQYAVVGPETAFEGLPQFGKFLPESAPGKVGKGVRAGRAFEEGLEHQLRRQAHDVGGYRGELDIGRLKELMETIHFTGPLLDQGGTVAGEVPQIPDRLGRNKSPFEKTMSEKICDPLAVLHIGLSPWYCLDVSCIHDQKGEGFLQDGIDGLPEDARAFHGRMGNPIGTQPVGEDEQFVGRRPKGLHFLLGGATIIRGSDARYDLLLVDIQTGTLSVDNFHNRPPLDLLSPGDADRKKNLPGVLPLDERQQFRVPHRHPGHVIYRAYGTKLSRPLFKETQQAYHGYFHDSRVPAGHDCYLRSSPWLLVRNGKEFNWHSCDVGESIH